MNIRNGEGSGNRFRPVAFPLFTGDFGVVRRGGNQSDYRLLRSFPLVRGTMLWRWGESNPLAAFLSRLVRRYLCWSGLVYDSPLATFRGR